jgi:hypothetical protein
MKENKVEAKQNPLAAVDVSIVPKKKMGRPAGTKNKPKIVLVPKAVPSNVAVKEADVDKLGAFLTFWKKELPMVSLSNLLKMYYSK